METLEIVKLVIAVVATYFVLRLLWNVVSGMVKFVLLIVLVAVGTYFVKPDILYGVFGEDTVESVKANTEKVVKDGAEKGAAALKNSLN